VQRLCDRSPRSGTTPPDVAETPLFYYFADCCLFARVFGNGNSSRHTPCAVNRSLCGRSPRRHTECAYYYCGQRPRRSTR
jgi:hypothetical protein